MAPCKFKKVARYSIEDYYYYHYYYYYCYHNYYRHHYNYYEITDHLNNLILISPIYPINWK